MPEDMKSIIAAALTELIQRGNIDKITVKALIEECHISRQTFYYHFQDLMDVIEWTMRQTTRQLSEESRKQERMIDALKVFISFARQHAVMIRKLMDSQRRPQIEKMMIDSSLAYLREMAQNRPELSLDPADREILLRYTAFGLTGVLLEYGEQDDLDEERLAAQLARILRGELSEWQKPCR